MRLIALFTALAALCAANLAADDAAIAKLLDETKVNLEVDRAPILKVLMTVSRMSRVPVLLDPVASSGVQPAAKATITLAAHDMSARDVLAAVCKQARLSFVVAEGLVFVTERRRVEPVIDGEFPEAIRKKLEGAPVNINVEEEPLRKTLATLLESLGYPPDIPKAASLDRRVSLETFDMNALQALNWLCRVGDARWRFRDGTVVVTYLPGDARLRMRLDQTTVSLRFDKQFVFEAIDYLETIGNINIIPDLTKLTEPAMTVTLKVDNVSLREALDGMTKAAGFAWVVRDGVVFITDEATARKLAGAPERRVYPADRPTEADQKVLAQIDDTFVSFTFNNQPVMEAIDFLVTLGNVNIVLERGALKDREQATVLIKLTNVPMRSAITLVAEQLGLAWTIRDGAVVLEPAAGGAKN